MAGVNVIAVLNKNCDKILMCKRRKNPYKGLLNLVGGKIEQNENGMDAAYRELKEETDISKTNIKLTHLMDFTYYLSDICLEVYVGQLNEEIKVYGEENELVWTDLNQDFFDSSIYAGEGNIGHILEHIWLAKEELLT